MKKNFLVKAGCVTLAAIMTLLQPSQAIPTYASPVQTSSSQLIVITETGSEEAAAFEAEENEAIFSAKECRVYQVEPENGETIEEALERYENAPGVLAVFPDEEIELIETSDEEKSDNEGSDEESMSAPVNDPDYNSQNYLSLIDAVSAWDVLNTYRHEKVKVCVLDSGADYSDPDLANVINLELSGEIWPEGDAFVVKPLRGDDYSCIDDPGQKKNGHGTHVCGIIAAESNNETGIAGVASAAENDVVELVVVDVFRSSSTPISYVIAGIEYAKSIGADVVNLSLGVNYGGVSAETVEGLSIICQALLDEGIVTVCAAGNGGINDKGEPQIIPADLDSVINVAWVNNDFTRGMQGSYSSNYGLLKDIAAPGTNIYSINGRKTGTSMAAPMVTATAAMMLSINPQLTRDEILAIMKETASPCVEEALSNIGVVQTGAAVREAMHRFRLPFLDVTEGAWYYEYIHEIYLRGIMTGMTAQLFKPEGKLSRAQFAMVLYRLAGAEEVEFEALFPDVEEDDWYAKACVWAKKNGVINGYDNGKFGPSDYITREQITTMLYRYAGAMNYDQDELADLSGYEDAGRISGFAIIPFQWAVGEEIIMGKNETTLDPVGLANRAECATMITRFIKKFM